MPLESWFASVPLLSAELASDTFAELESVLAESPTEEESAIVESAIVFKVSFNEDPSLLPSLDESGLPDESAIPLDDPLLLIFGADSQEQMPAIHHTSANVNHFRRN